MRKFFPPIIFCLLFLLSCNPPQRERIDLAGKFPVKNIFHLRLTHKWQDNEFKKKLHRPLPPDIVQLINSICDCDEPGAKLDSSNTRYFDITVGLEEKYFLVELGDYCHQSGGSCGYSILVVEKLKNGNGKIIENNCGFIDTIFNTSHNGMFDYKLDHSLAWRPNGAYYRFDGNKIIEIENSLPQSDTVLIENALTTYYPKKFYFPTEEINFRYVQLGNSNCRFVEVTDFPDIYLLRECSPGNFEVVNYFEDTVVIDIREALTKNMHDIHTFEGMMETERCWKWNGRQYVRVKK